MIYQKYKLLKNKIMEELLVTNQETKTAKKSKSWEEFKKITLPEVKNMDQITFSLEHITQEMANLISTTGRITKAIVVCNDVDACLENFRKTSIGEIKRSDIMFVPNF